MHSQQTERRHRVELDQLAVAEPCQASWDAMQDTGDGRRFCDGCAKHVHDLSRFTAAQAQRLIADAHVHGRSVCVRYQKASDGRILTRDRPAYRGWRRLTATFATLLGCGSLITAGLGCGPTHATLLRSNFVARWLERTLFPPHRPAVQGEMRAHPVVMGDVAMPPPPVMGRIAPPATSQPTSQPAAADRNGSAFAGEVPAIAHDRT